MYACTCRLNFVSLYMYAFLLCADSQTAYPSCCRQPQECHFIVFFHFLCERIAGYCPFKLAHVHININTLFSQPIHIWKEQFIFETKLPRIRSCQYQASQNMLHVFTSVYTQIHAFRISWNKALSVSGKGERIMI